MKTTTATLKLALAAAIASVTMLTFTSAASALPWGITEFDGGTFKATPNLVTPDPENRAGAHPMTAWTEFSRLGCTFLCAPGEGDEKLKDTIVDLPPGFVGNLEAVPACPAGALPRSCPLASEVGVVHLYNNGWLPLYRTEAPDGVLASFKFEPADIPVYVTAKLRSDGDYGVTASALNAPSNVSDTRVKVILWGVPADPAWDSIRGDNGECLDENPSPATPQPRSNPGCPASVPGPRKPFLTLPTSCVGPIDTFLRIDSWAGSTDRGFFTSHDNSMVPLGTEECNVLDFSPTLEARPTTNVADSPSGLDVDIHIPQNNDPDQRSSAHLRDTTLTLPEGLNVNPGAANGLDACSSGQAGLLTPVGQESPIHFSDQPTNCPNAAKLGTVQVHTPALDHPVPGAVYIAKPFDNPFGSFLAIYITVDDPITGVAATIAGKVSADPVTGQLTTVVKDNPQLPLEDIRVNLFGGAGGSLRTPATCGTYETTSSLTPWSAPDTGPADTPSDFWTIQQGPNGAPCASTDAERPNAPSFDAGAVSPIAGAHSPFVVNLRRDDATQEFSAVTVKPPLGLTAKLAGTPACSDAALAAAAAKRGTEEQASPSCPAASEVGSVVAGAGAGPAPYYAPGKVYLAGPYKGAPLSLVAIVPAVAGPFDLGTVVTRIATHVNPKTAEITAVSDPLPSILEGIPLDVRSAHVALNKPDFTLNPTSCDPMAVTGELTSILGAIAPLESRFQLGECANLGFKPKMVLRLKGGTKRGKHPQLTVSVFPRPGDANIRSVSVAFPRSEFLENAHIRTICTRPDFAADNCPSGAVYGSSTVITPLLDYPLTGNVYLRSSDNLLPDVVPDLRGPAYQPIKLEAAGRTDSIRGGIRNTFDFFPDAPFTKAVVRMQGGSKGLLVNSRNICAKTYRAKVVFTGHNGERHTIRPKMKAQCRKGKRKGKKAKRSSHSRSSRAVR